jgi:hypothetical protein
VGEEEDGGLVGLGHAWNIVYWPPSPRVSNAQDQANRRFTA